MILVSLLSSELCRNCGCPRVVHHHDGHCVHCAAFENKNHQCHEFTTQDDVTELVVLNRYVIQELFLLGLAAGFCLGIGLLSIAELRSLWISVPLLLIGIMITFYLSSFVPSHQH